ncbi:helix-turn-helix domain-containing protein [Microbacterium plantarum]|uniref:helix-turn-helix domain-containing protein n=1 Tax=Microbacterium plantarum TaxID=1816425 RepID=UPI002B4A145F|nr:helix-turn-helix transcriptional regulator [Microbacterium plantarum]WRK16156.1 helix-turn-helix transcriptional regulator [Microbacterium plantarum]
MATELTDFSLRVAGAVRAELARRNLSREHLIPVLGIGKNAVYARIRGEQSFEVEELAKIAAHLEIDISALVSPAMQPAMAVAS